MDSTEPVAVMAVVLQPSAQQVLGSRLRRLQASASSVLGIDQGSAASPSPTRSHLLQHSRPSAVERLDLALPPMRATSALLDSVPWLAAVAFAASVAVAAVTSEPDGSAFAVGVLLPVEGSCSANSAFAFQASQRSLELASPHLMQHHLLVASSSSGQA